MRGRLFFVILTAAALAGCNRPGSRQASPPPLIVDTNSPLLLDEPDVSAAAATPGADNSACFVCHVNYQTEVLAATHARANIGCADCHGRSQAHCNDENNTTPPQIMYPVEQIDESCRHCHMDHDVPPAKVVARWQQRSKQTRLKTAVCTDCHGSHCLKLRTVRWDKKTGKLT